MTSRSFRFARSHPMALATHILSALAIWNCVFWYARMPALAEANLLILSDNAALNVFSMGNNFQMARIYATPHAAEMIDLQPGGDVTVENFVADSVRSEEKGSVAVTIGEEPITVGIQLSSPEPTAGVWLHRNVLHEAFRDRLVVGHVTPFSRIALGLRALERLRAFSILAQTGGGWAG